MFKYFLACGESDLVKDGKLLLGPLGEAAVALRDCTKLTSQCTVQNCNAIYKLGSGVMIDPHPGDGSRPGDTRPPENWNWLPFETGLVKPNAQGTPERVQGLIGYDPHATFKPELIRRRRMIGGESILGKDEASWLIPIARSPAMAFGTLSTRWAPTPGGKWEMRLDKGDAALWELSGEVQDFLAWNRQESPEPRPQWDDPWSLDVTLQILGVNYRIGRPELLVLDALDANPISSMFMIRVLHALTGHAEWQAWLEELQKKSGQATNPAPEDSNSGTGGQEALDAVLAGEN